MASSKYKGFHRKKLNSQLCGVVSNLRKENAYLKTALVELSRQHAEHYKLVEVNLIKQISLIICIVFLVAMMCLRVMFNVLFLLWFLQKFLSLQIARLENYKQQTTKDEKTLLSEHFSETDGNLMDAVNEQRQRNTCTSTKQMEEIENKLRSISTTCQCPKMKVAGNKV